MDPDIETHAITRRRRGLMVSLVIITMVMVVIIPTMIPVMVMPYRRHDDYRPRVVIMMHLIGHPDSRYRQEQKPQKSVEQISHKFSLNNFRRPLSRHT
jgi:hypothetical protein